MPAMLIQQNVPLHDKNWFGTGGAAAYFAAPENAEQFQEAILFAGEQNLPITLIGEGANCLISDAGISGLVIQPKLNKIVFHDDTLVTAQAGVSLEALIKACLEHGLTGLEEFSGIPGTVGGSVYINIHYFEFLLSHFLLRARVMEKTTGDILQVDNAWFAFGYNKSKLQYAPYYLLDATFALKKSDSLSVAYAQGRSAEIIRHRKARYPNAGTCGSFFRNFLPHELTSPEKQPVIYVAYYLDKLGFKGHLRMGGASVSHQHANMIVNTGSATSSDIILLARTMQEAVKEHFGLTPKPECRLLGFESYPLLP